ncbi:MAG: hypothetical protein OEW64_08455 [Gammaproteobacteria bacterium]|nr:hypothetical protein [Gammaproteobacteria bacterium]MDH5304117.1 hypothetical protein [Gammaproteobacteria bacterium]MDH5323111.1 hypothetical protein [Gammaproteobacteria bacterium]
MTKRFVNAHVVLLVSAICALPDRAGIAQDEWRELVMVPGMRVAGQGWTLTVPALGNWMQLTASAKAVLYGRDATCALLQQAPEPPLYGTQVQVEICAVRPDEDPVSRDPASTLIQAEIKQVHLTATNEGQTIRNERTTVQDKNGSGIHLLSFRIQWPLVNDVPIFVDTAISCPPEWQSGQSCLRVSYTRYGPTKHDPGMAVVIAFMSGLTTDGTSLTPSG